MLNSLVKLLNIALHLNSKAYFVTTVFDETQNNINSFIKISCVVKYSIKLKWNLKNV